ncbi:hypothetical protein Pr1d_42850 [Bythopirellula goksoeyrii]|uniref:YrhK domain-containing protein n=2 Tax=Bythopirellula goksoeyrii TaxID=1400387 RepID=A0A5B9QH27_9BACT|nr:hypothetical protein Pr1d_42850 [Bythopirellula goksoeyrii]
MLNPDAKQVLREKSRAARSKIEGHAPDSRFVERYSWLFVVVGLVGNMLFFVGSVGFLFPSFKILATWMFILGSCLMLVSSSAAALDEYTNREAK